MLKALLRSPSLRTAAAMGVGGVGFSLGSLLLARELPTAEYGLVALVLGVVAVGGLAAPPARIEPDAAVVYHLSPSLAAAVAAITLALGVAQSVGGHFQGRQDLRVAVWVVQLLNGSLAAVAILNLGLGLTTARAVCSLTAAVGLTAAAAVWWLLRRGEGSGAPQPAPWGLRREAISLLAVQTGGSVFLQLERLLIGPVAGLHELAVYSVLAAFVSSPFRLLQAAVQFSLIPTLRIAGDVHARRAKLAREALLVLATVAAGSVAIWVLAPPLAHWLVAGRYTLPHALIAAALVSGLLKVVSGFTTAVVVSCGEERRLRRLSLVCWGSIGVGVAGAFCGGRWGLIGVLYGIAAGWLVRSLLTGWLAMAHLRAGGEARDLPRRTALGTSPPR